MTGFAGNCDGLDGGELHGWAWRPSSPGSRVEVEQWVDGILAARTVADLPRGDLLAGGVGDGAYGWRMPLALDPGKAGPQRVEVRARDGGLLPNGTFQLSCEAARRDEEDAPAAASGHCDGRDGHMIYGWAWRPAVPEQHVVVEQWVDGALVAETVADRLRADLLAAFIGHAHYGFEMPLMLDPAKRGRQAVELRIKGAGPIANGRFELAYDAIQAHGAKPAEAAAPGGVVGRCDGLKGSALYGWAWNPSNPDEPVEVELWIDGALVATSLADGFRPDLRSNRIGAGRHGWRLPVDLGRFENAPSKVEVRARNGPPLEGGVMELKSDLSLDNPVNATLRPFVEAVLNPGAEAPPAPAARPTFLLYCPPPTKAGKFWAREYDDDAAAMKAFAPALARLGDVVVLEGLAAAEAICAERREEGRPCMLLSFGPPRRAPLQAPCPVVPAFAWAFPQIPTGAWDGDPRSDWRSVLGFAGRAITFSRFAAEAVQAAMGPGFPVAAIFPPVRDAPQPPQAPQRRRGIRLDGVVFDSRKYKLDPESLKLPPPIWTGGAGPATGREIEIEGVLFTSFLDFNDGRKNWADLVSAFTAANRDKADAALLLKLSDPNAAWMQQLYRWLAAQPPFACRVLAMRGSLEEVDYDTLIAASHWYASACNAEGLCLPMQDFLAAGRPAIAPAHTALVDHLDADNALIVDSDEEAWRWPLDGFETWSWTQHPDDVGLTTRRRVSWSSLVAAFGEAYRLSAAAPEDYARMSAAAAARARAACGPDAIAAALQDLLGRGRPGPAGADRSPLTTELAAG
jgi:hypothetical protein